jgi:streptogramin lyase
MTRGTRARLVILMSAALMPLLTGCSGGGSSAAPEMTPSSRASSPQLRVDATIDVAAAGAMVTTHDRLWVISGGKTFVTQIDPANNSVTAQVTLPHPAASGTVAHGSLWLVSFGENALMELDSRTGKFLRTLEGSPALPFDEPVGVAVTGHDVWVVNHGNSKLLRIDARTGRLTQTTQFPGDAAAGPALVNDRLWIGLTAQGIVYQVDPSTGRIVGKPIHVATGLCAWSSVVDDDIWMTSIVFADFDCVNGTSRLDTKSGHVTPLGAADGMSLYSFAQYDGVLWATDTGRKLYKVNASTDSLLLAMTLDRRDADHIFAAFGSLWMTRSEAGEVLRLDAS